MPIQTFNSFPRPIPDSGGGSNIKSIQRGSTTVTATPTNVTISAVDLTKAIIMIYVTSDTVSTASAIAVSATFTSSTQITFTLVSAASSRIVKWQVIEFNNVKSLQTGTTNLTTGTTNTVGSVNATVSPVNTGKSILFVSRTTMSGTDATTPQTFAGEVINSTTLTFSAFWQTGLTIAFQWFLIEFN